MVNTDQEAVLDIAGQKVQVIRKGIKNLHVGVYPPDGHVRVAAPPSVSLDAIRGAVLTRLSWIKDKQSGFRRQARESKRSFISGETHFLFGRPCRLEVRRTDGQKGIDLVSSDRIVMRCSADATTEDRSDQMAKWYRHQLRDKTAVRVENWARRLGVQSPIWGIRRMKTKWGSCNVESRKIWLNLELAKKPLQCLDYVILHETAHLISARHDVLFVETLDRHFPGWRQVRSDLNAFPLAFEPSFEGGASTVSSSSR